jgi:hypothetical protein
MAFVKDKDYSNISLDDFSDDDSSDDEIIPRQRRNGGGFRDNPTPTNDVAGSSIHRQQQLMQQQDQGLEMLSQSAVRLGQLSNAISDDLEQQNKMLDEIDDDMDAAVENLDFVTRKTKEFIELSGGQKNCIVIVTLAAICILLLFLILYG